MYQIYPRLSSEELISVQSDLNLIVNRVISKLSETDAEKFISWLHEVSLLNLTFILRPDSIEKVQELVFSDGMIRDALLEIQFRFYTLVSPRTEFIDSLVQNILDGLCVDGPDQTHSLLPESVAKSTALAVFKNNEDKGLFRKLFSKVAQYKEPQIAAFLMLRNNAWLVTLIMLILGWDEAEQQ